MLSIATTIYDQSENSDDIENSDRSDCDVVPESHPELPPTQSAVYVRRYMKKYNCAYAFFIFQNTNNIWPHETRTQLYIYIRLACTLQGRWSSSATSIIIKLAA